MSTRQKMVLLISLLSLLTAIHDLFPPRPSQVFTMEPERKFDPQIAVTVSAYSPTEEECDSDPYITAFQKPVREGTIAISRDLERDLGWRFGDRIHIKGLGVFEVWDRMHPRWRKRVDIFFHDTEKAVSFGVRQAKAIKVERLQRSGV